MTYEFVPFAITISYRGNLVCAVGFPIFWLWPGLESWLERTVQDL